MKTSGITVLFVFVALALAGCSGATGITTGSLFGTSEEAKPAGPVNDPPMRAFQVGTVSARGIKCGFNFDPAKLKVNYLAYERSLAGPAADLSKIEKIYDVSFNGVAKAVSSETEYCSAAKTKTIKADLGRHLAGDYTPSAQPKGQEDDDGLFAGWGSGDSNSSPRSTISVDNSDI